MFAAVYLVDLQVKQTIHVNWIYGFNPFSLIKNGVNCGEPFIIYFHTDKSVSPRFTSDVERKHFQADKCYIAQIYKFFG